MAVHVSNMKELEKALKPIMVGMVNNMSEKIYETLNYFLQVYYNSYDPKSYRRQMDFLRSAVKLEAKSVGDKVIASVYIDYDSMDNYYNATGYQVVDWANQGLHGGLDTGTDTPHIWDDTIDATVQDGELLKAAIRFLRSRGINVRI